MKLITKKMSHCIVFKGDSSSGTNKNSAVNSKQDKLFDPSIDMMVNDFDDEQTLEEEEALAAVEAEDPNAELSSLQREGDMPLEELLALYGYGNAHDSEVDNAEMAPDQRDHQEVQDVDIDADPEVDGEEEPDLEPDPDPDPAEDDSKMQLESSKLQQLYDPIPDTDHDAQDGSRLLRSVSRVHSEEEDDDYDYSPDEDEWKKTIMVGQDYQAGIPEGLCSYDDALPYENEDKLLWDPHPLLEQQTEDFLWRATVGSSGVAALPKGCQLRDDEQALFLLLQCGHNVEEALRRRRIHSIPASDTMSLWSEEECRNFENGLRSYGKDFHLIQQNKVRTRSVGELVQFYYLWKKTERHDVFANKARLEKKKYTLHPGLTDFMDRFLEEQDGGRDRSSSPNMQCVSVSAGAGAGTGAGAGVPEPKKQTVLANNGTASVVIPALTALTAVQSPISVTATTSISTTSAAGAIAASATAAATTHKSEQTDVRM